MPWSDERVEQIIQHYDTEALLWLLIMYRGGSSTGVHVGSEKAKNAVKLYSKVRSYAKKHGINPPPNEKKIKQGYKRLLRVQLSHPDLGEMAVIKGDKIDYLKLSRVGKRLVTRIHTDSDLKNLAKVEAGLDIDIEPEPKWPDEYDQDDATVTMLPTESVSEQQEPFQLPTHARFDCPICSETVTHKYTFQYPTDAWSESVETKCGRCNSELRHSVGDPYSQVKHIG